MQTENPNMVAQSDLRRVARAAESVVRAQADLAQAIRLARASGETLNDIGKAAGLTRQRIHQMTR